MIYGTKSLYRLLTTIAEVKMTQYLTIKYRKLYTVIPYAKGHIFHVLVIVFLCPGAIWSQGGQWTIADLVGNSYQLVKVNWPG